MNLLLVEDDPLIGESLSAYLTQHQYQVQWVKTLKEAQEHLSPTVKAVILDWMLPDGEGTDWLKNLRKSWSHLPVIMLTARTDLVDKVMGLELGAQDYLTKPFEPRELLARIRVQLRGHQTAVKDLFEAGGITIESSSMEVRFHGKPVILTPMEFKLLKIFLQNPRRVFTRDALLDEVWGLKYPTTRTVDTHILQLRQKFLPAYFETVHGLGYRFNPDIQGT